MTAMTDWTPQLEGYDGPKYRALAAALRDGISKGALGPGSKLPPVRDLAWKLGITPGTVARAYTLLTDAGICDATVGRGTFVAPPKSAAERLVPVDALLPVDVDAVPHGSEGQVAVANFLSPALPNLGQTRLIKELLAEVAHLPPSGLMHYPNRDAFRPAREAALAWLADVPVGRATEDDVVLTHGGQNGISLCLQAALTGAKPVVLVEELTYPGFRRAAEMLRADMVPVAMDGEGIIPSAFEDAARRYGAQVLLTSPEVHNPTTTFTPDHRRREIARVAARCNVQIIEDDCSRMGPSRAPSYRMIAPERSWYVSSISKQITPALRMGWALAPEGRSAVLRRVAEYGFFGLSAPMADLMSKLLVHPKTRPICEAVTETVAQYVQCAVNHLGGYDLAWRSEIPFLWLVLPTGWRASSFCQAAARQNIQLRPAEDFIGRDARAPHAVRIAVNAQLPFERFEAEMRVVRGLLDRQPESFGV